MQRQAQDIAAMGIKRLWPRAYGAASRVLKHDHDAASDVAQKVLLRFFCNARLDDVLRLAAEESVTEGAWVERVEALEGQIAYAAYKEALTELRSRRRYVTALEKKFQQATVADAGQRVGADDALALARAFEGFDLEARRTILLEFLAVDADVERLVTLAEALAQLDSDHRRLIILRYVIGLTEEAMAKMLDTSRGTVRRRLKEAFELLEQQLRSAAIAPSAQAVSAGADETVVRDPPLPEVPSILAPASESSNPPSASEPRSDGLATVYAFSASGRDPEDGNR